MTTTTADATTTRSWHDIDTAADLLGISRRTLQRRIAAGLVPSMLDDTGRRLVAVDVAADGRPAGGDTTAGHDATRDAGGLALLAETMQAAIDRQLVVAGTAIERADRLADAWHADLAAARRSSRAAWAAVAAVVAACGAGGWWTADRLAEARTRLDAAQAAVADAEQDAAGIAAERDELHRDLGELHREAGELAGRLAAAQDAAAAAVTMARQADDERDRLQDRVAELEAAAVAVEAWHPPMLAMPEPAISPPSAP